MVPHAQQVANYVVALVVRIFEHNFLLREEKVKNFGLETREELCDMEQVLQAASIPDRTIMMC